MKNIIYTLLLLPLLFLTACSSTPTQIKMVNQPLSKLENERKKDIMNATAMVFMDNGFDIMFMNENLGIINTNWRDTTSKSEKNINSLGNLSRALGGGITTDTNTRMQIQFKLNENEYKLLPKLQRTSTQKGGLTSGTQSTNEMKIKEDSDYGKLIEKITSDINTLLGIENAYYWETKTE